MGWSGEDDWPCAGRQDTAVRRGGLIERRCVSAPLLMVGQFFGKDGCAEFAGVNPERPAQLEYFHDLLDARSLCERARNAAADARGVEVGA
jgi:hypothetical protein